MSDSPPAIDTCQATQLTRVDLKRLPRGCAPRESARPDASFRSQIPALGPMASLCCLHAGTCSRRSFAGTKLVFIRITQRAFN